MHRHELKEEMEEEMRQGQNHHFVFSVSLTFVNCQTLMSLILKYILYL